MLHVIPGTQGYGITDDLEIFYDGKVIHNDINKSIQIKVLDKLVTNKPNWFYGIAMVGHVDEFDIDHLHFVFNPQSRSKFPWYAWYDTPKVVFDDFRVVPGYPNVAVNCDGVPIDSVSGKEYKCVISHNYRYIYCYINLYQKKLFVPVYKLVALAWLDNDESITRFVVNHKDPTGTPLNDSVTNLEWTTYKGNNDHAVHNGLIESAVGCKIRNVNTGEIKEFPSLSSMFGFFGVDYSKGFCYFTKNRCNKLYGGEWEVRLNDDERPWIYEMSAQNVEPSRYIITITEPNSEPKVFNGVRKVIKHYKLWNLPTWSCKVVVERLKEEHPEFVIEVIDQYDTRKIEVKDLESGTVSEYDSITILAKSRNWRKSSIIDCMKSEGTRALYDRFAIRHKTNSKWPDTKPSESRPKSLVLIDKDTKEEITCESFREASRFLGRDRDYIRRCIDAPKETDKYVIKQLPLPREIEVAKKVNC